MTESDLVRLRALVANEPERHAADLAVALRALGRQRAEIGEYGAAVAAATEAVALYRRLADDDSPTFEPALAGALLDLGNRHSDIGDWASARAALTESVERFRSLAGRGSDPDLAHLYWLGAALDYLGIAQAALGEHDAALAATEESVRIYEWLNYEVPVDLAEALTNLSDRLAAIGDNAVALATARGANRLYREMVVEHADRIRADHAAFLLVLSRRFVEDGELESAMLTAHRSVILFRELDADRARTQRPKYAEALLMFASVGHAVADLEELEEVDEVDEVEVLAAAREAVEIYRDLAQRAPRRYVDRLAEAESMVDSLRPIVTEVRDLHGSVG
jgi:tetratricopeptide (TPR) repeat protein